MKLFPRFAVIILSVFIVACGQSYDPQPQTLRGNIFGTFFEVSIGAEHEFDRDQLQQDIMQVLNTVDEQMSTYRSESDLNRLNQAPLHEPVEIPSELFYVLDVSETIAARSGGTFDHTVGSLVNLWGFGPQGRIEKRPNQRELEQRLEQVGYHYLILDGDAQTAMRTRDIFVDLSGIAKGYGVDAVSDYLTGQGITNHLVNIGGDLKASGERVEGQNWRVGIEAPNDSRQVVRHILPVTDIAMVSSGDYRNYFEENGVRYSHNIDPTTGEPISHKLAAVTVLASNATLADGYATALMIQGPERGLRFANDQDIAALFIVRKDDSFETLLSESFKREHEDRMSVPRVQ